MRAHIHRYGPSAVRASYLHVGDGQQEEAGSDLEKGHDVQMRSRSKTQAVAAIKIQAWVQGLHYAAVNRERGCVISLCLRRSLNQLDLRGLACVDICNHLASP